MQADSLRSSPTGLSGVGGWAAGEGCMKPQEGVGGFDRGIRTKGKQGSLFKERLPGIGEGGSFTPIAVCDKHIGCGVNWLHGGDDMQCGKAWQVSGM
mgnify:CR=1 FL=1